MFSCITPPRHLSQVMETTNEVMDHSLFELVTHEAAMSYHRVRRQPARQQRPRVGPVGPGQMVHWVKGFFYANICLFTWLTSIVPAFLHFILPLPHDVTRPLNMMLPLNATTY